MTDYTNLEDAASSAMDKINELESEISDKDSEISDLETKIEELEESISIFKDDNKELEKLLDSQETHYKHMEFLHNTEQY